MSKKIFAGVLALALAVVAYSGANAAYMHAGTLKVGSRGAQVTSLQATLNMTSCKVGAGVATGYFGPLTKAAVQCFQSSHGLTADGVVGPMTGAQLALVAGSTGGDTDGSSTPGCPAGALYNTMTGAPCSGSNDGSSSALNGTDGTIATVTQLSQYSGEEVGEGANDVKVLGFEVEASNDGDIQLKSVKLAFNDYAGSGSNRISNYVDGVTVWMDDTKIGSADIADFNKDSSGVYSKTITLNNSAIIRADKKAKFYVTVDAVNGFDSGDISAANDWHIDLDSIRYVDGSGVVTTESTAGDLPIQNTAINFVSFSTAADTKLKVSLDPTSPDSGIVIVSETSITDNVVLLKGKLKLDGTSDVLLNTFPVTLTETGASTSGVSALTGNLTLSLDGQKFSKTVTSTAASATVTFDKLDFNISAGDSVNFTVMADVEDILATSGSTTAYDQGDTLAASLTSTNRDYMDVENAQGDQLSDSTEKSGTATGDAQEFRSSGVKLELVGSPSTSVTQGTGANDDLGTFTIKFTVKAVGDDIYVASLADAVVNSTTTTGKTSVQFDRAGTATNGGTSVTIVNKGTGADSTTLNNAGLWLISDGNSQTFEVTGTGQLPSFGSAGQYRMSLIGLSWTTDSTDPTPDNKYTSNLSEFVTSYVGLN